MRKAIIIPNRNGAMYIKKVLNHICENKLKAPVYFYDDYSDDDSVDIALGYRGYHCLNKMRVYRSGKRRGFEATVFRVKELAELDGYDRFLVVNLYDIIKYD